MTPKAKTVSKPLDARKLADQADDASRGDIHIGQLTHALRVLSDENDELRRVRGAPTGIQPTTSPEKLRNQAKKLRKSGIPHRSRERLDNKVAAMLDQAASLIESLEARVSGTGARTA